QTILTVRSSASAGAPKSADPPVETSTKYDMIGSLKIAEALRSIVSPKLLVPGEGVISGPRRACILVGAAFALILAILVNGRMAAVAVGLPQPGQASMETSSARTAPASEAPAATVDAMLATTGPASATEQRVVPEPLASLDPADRVIAEKIRYLLVAKSGR